MIRIFNTHQLREQQSLDGLWQFATANDKLGRVKKNGLPSNFPRTIWVPSAWEHLPGLENYRGKGWLRRTITVDQDCQAVRLAFAGVSHTARVFVDGQYVGEHYDAFTPFEIVVPDLATGEHELVVEVDNSFGDHSALHIENDYMTYGGITRPVVMQLMTSTYIQRLHATPVQKKNGWELDIRATIANQSQAGVTREVIVRVAGSEIALGPVSFPAGKSRELAATLKGLDVSPWSPDSPTLYHVHAWLTDQGTPVDDLIERVGFREVKVRGDKILINGKAVRLRGYNRHEDHPHFGSSLPVEAMMADLVQLRDLGSNFIRTCHYPNDQRFLDLCDELGLFVWEESHARTVSFDHPKYREQIAQSTTEMIQWHYNHPSIIMWGCLNECETRTKAGYREHKRVLDLIKKLDASRPNTYAGIYREADLCCALADIVSINLYTGWYGGTPEQTRPVIDRFINWIHAPENAAKGKPIIVSEFGAGGIYGHREPRATHWTEEYQCQVLEENLEVYLNHKAISGVAIWQFCDVRITPHWWSHRPRNRNNKGTVDEYRRPKLCYDVVKRKFEEAARRFDD